jgi:hypothetical protein
MNKNTKAVKKPKIEPPVEIKNEEMFLWAEIGDYGGPVSITGNTWYETEEDMRNIIQDDYSISEIKFRKYRLENLGDFILENKLVKIS